MGYLHATYVTAVTSWDTFSSQSIVNILKVVLAGIFFGMAASIFASLSHGIKGYFKKFIPRLTWFHPFIGGWIIVGYTYIFIAIIGDEARDYLGLGVIGMRPDSVLLCLSFLPFNVGSSFLGIMVGDSWIKF
jgi:H+/Cl- antiporter ClcA